MADVRRRIERGLHHQDHFGHAEELADAAPGQAFFERRRDLGRADRAGHDDVADRGEIDIVEQPRLDGCGDMGRRTEHDRGAAVDQPVGVSLGIEERHQQVGGARIERQVGTAKAEDMGEGRCDHDAVVGGQLDRR